MKITCISAANIEVARANSASVRTCELVRDLLLAEHPDAQVTIVPLLDYEMKPCRMCGKCLESQRCARDEAFNQVFEQMIAADGLFVVAPHYAPLPSKLMILAEKMEEISFLNSCANQSYHFPLSGKPAGVIGHGGQQTSEGVLNYYQRMVVEPVAMALASVGMRIVPAGEGLPNGAAFGIRSLSLRPGSAFVDIEQDWEDVRQRVTPLVQHMSTALSQAKASPVV